MKILSIGNFDTFWKIALVSGGLAAWSLPVWNLVVNPYQVLSPNFSIGGRYTSPSTNERFLKVAHLLKEAKAISELTPDDRIAEIKAGHGSLAPVHDSLILGSSVMGLIDPALLLTFFPDNHFYNFAFLAAEPDEILASLKALHRNGVTIKRIIYGLEPVTFTDSTMTGPAFRLHSEATKMSRTRTALSYLFAPSLTDGLVRLGDLFSGETSIRYDIDGAGNYKLEQYDRELASDPQNFLKKHFQTHNQSLPPSWVGSRFEDLHQLANWLKQEDIAATFYLNPLHPAIVKRYDKARLLEFKAMATTAVNLRSIADCSHLFGEDIHFYDFKHFRASESRSVLRCALAGENQ